MPTAQIVRNKLLQTKVDTQTHKGVKKKAKLLRLTVSEYLRALVLADITEPQNTN